jgi:hypothetical protein
MNLIEVYWYVACYWQAFTVGALTMYLFIKWRGYEESY